MSEGTNRDSGSTGRQDGEHSASADRKAEPAPSYGRSRGLHPQTREALAQAVKRAATQFKRR
ncbi:hypothetical protein JYU29_01485 [Tianweitania sp. BSSL-BM11]|uniref:DUF3606 domain-containing protein n=1 Tax=Tianweitania aestuarii TaxID=2814886 RepID=A0ABS5RQN5_9HYPH|nr:hypothetical protein [Tianweitania aestuarii]MBS9719355.1 hypothetical protein [Tianweitania aestuarii]